MGKCPGYLSNDVFSPPELSFPPFAAQSLRHSLARVLSFYRTSSVVGSWPGAAHDFEKGPVSSEWGDIEISDDWQHTPFDLGSLSGKRGEEPAKPSIPIEKGKKAQIVKKRASCWIRCQLWFNTYRCVFSRHW